MFKMIAAAIDNSLPMIGFGLVVVTIVLGFLGSI